jgi:hypothetical protein
MNRHVPPSPVPTVYIPYILHYIPYIHFIPYILHYHYIVVFTEYIPWVTDDDVHRLYSILNIYIYNFVTEEYGIEFVTSGANDPVWTIQKNNKVVKSINEYVQVIYLICL